eukprot:scaffold25228_cov56-Phaeocystis_antarctica.AAC.1
MRGIWAAVDRRSQSDEMTTNGGQARTPSDRIVDGVKYLKRAPNRSKIEIYFYFERNSGCVETGGLVTTHGPMENRPQCRWNDRVGPQCAPK